MGTITPGIGLISGIDTATLIEQLLAIESRGKFALQQRIGRLQSQQTALLDINARLLNFKGAAADFRTKRIFESATALSSNESVLKATAKAGATPGSFRFIVDRLVSSSQQLSRGFTNLDDSPLGLDSMTFELGGGRVAGTVDLASLNGGDGVRRGKIRVTDAAGASAVVDLSRAGELEEVINAINSADGINVTARIDGDRLAVDDTSGGGGSLTIENVSGYFTATDLGIAGSDGGSGRLTGTNINAISTATSLASLNDGNGVLIQSGLGNVDFKITDRAGNAHNITLGQYDNGGTIEAKVVTLGDVIDRINTIAGGAVTAAIAANGVSLELTDTTGGSGNFVVAGGGTNGEQTARDLGILNGGVASATIDGDRVVAGMGSVLLKNLNGGAGVFGSISPLLPQTPLASLLNGAGISTNGNSGLADLQVTDRAGATYDVELDGLSTVQDLIDAFNTATGGTVSIAISGDALKVTNSSNGLLSFSVKDINGSLAANDLGIDQEKTPLEGNSFTGSDTNPLVTPTISITNRLGVETVVGLGGGESLSDIVSIINASGAGVTASLNDAGNGLFITDTTGGSSNLIIDGDAAGMLGIATDPAGVAEATVRGSNLQHRYVAGSTRLSELNYGRGIGTGSFRITDATGNSAVVDIGSDAVTLQDIISEINSKGLDINARVNSNGDGLLIENTSSTGMLAIRVENVSGSAGRNLGIIGTAADSGSNNFIDGSYERTITFESDATLKDIITAINDADIPVTASVINTGSGTNPYRLSITSQVSGERGELSIDGHGFDLGLSTLQRGQDSRVFFGSDDPAQAVMIESSSNSLNGIVQGVNIDLTATSDTAVTVNVTRNTQAIVDGVKRLVTTFNDVVGRFNQYDSYNAETEERGVLLGNSTVARVRSQLYRGIQKSAIGVDGEFQRLSQIGIRVGAKGELKLDETAFRAALEEDFEAVSDLFVAYDREVVEEEISPGITTGGQTEKFNSLGLAEQLNQLLDRLTNPENGVMSAADDSFDSIIAQTNRRIEQFDVRLEGKRLLLERQFAAMEKALAQLQGQQGALTSLSNAALTASLSGVRRR
ncbi:MAG: flagellar filament capping protein FliD [Phycisphaerales bacterium]